MNHLFDVPTSRVKSLSFHPTSPLLLISTHTGQIILYNLHLNTITSTLTHHDGPVRCVSFCPAQPNLFASCSDDRLINIYQLKPFIKKVHVFKGHTDYIRSLQFHPDQPFLLSCSDDMTVRMWNVLNLKCEAVLTGHSHYVMCATFLTNGTTNDTFSTSSLDNKSNLIVSCSLDMTMRLWNFDSLVKNKKYTKDMNKNIKSSSVKSLLGVPNVEVKQIVEAHDKGVNWVYPHPTKNTFLSCGDDRSVKVWEYNNDIVWEKEVMYSHQNNVTGVAFLSPCGKSNQNSDDCIVSVGEDGLINFYHKKKTDKLVFNTRFWCVSPNKDNTLFAVGHDEGFKIYSTMKNESVYDLNDSGVFYLNSGNNICYNDLESEKIAYKPRKEVVKIQTCVSDFDLEDKKKYTSKNKKDYSECMLVQYPKSFEIVDRSGGIVLKSTGKGILLKNDILLYTFTSPLSLLKSVIYNKEYNIPQNVDKIERISSNKLCLSILSPNPNTNQSDLDSKYTHSIDIFCLESNKTIKNIKVNSKLVKTVVSPKVTSIICDKQIVFVDTHTFDTISTVSEMVSIISGYFSLSHLKTSKNNNVFVFIYNTIKQIKYVILTHPFKDSSEHGILKSIEKKINIFTTEKQQKTDIQPNLNKSYIFYITGQKIENVKVNFDEVMFKISVKNNDVKYITSYLNSKKVIGQSIIKYIIGKGYGQYIIPYLKEKKTEVLISMGKLEEALDDILKKNTLKNGDEIDFNENTQCLYDLILNKALQMCNLEVAEKVLKITKDYKSLFMLYLCSKQNDKIRSLLKYGNDHFKMEVAVFLDDSNVVRDILRKNRYIISEKSKENKEIVVSDEEKNLESDDNNEDTFEEGNIESEIDFDEEDNVETSEEKIMEKESISVTDDENSDPKINDNDFEEEFKKILGLKINEKEKNTNLDSKSNDNDFEEEFEKNLSLKNNKTEENINFNSENNDSDDLSLKINEKEESINLDTKINEKEESDFEEEESDKYSESNENTTLEELKNLSIKEKNIDNEKRGENIKIESKESVNESYDSESDKLDDFDDKNEIEDLSFEKEQTSEESEIEELQNSIIDISLLKSKEDQVKEIKDIDDEFQTAMKNITDGKFTSALTLLKKLILFIAVKISQNTKKQNNFEDLRKKIGTYILGLSIEKRKKKVNDTHNLLKLSQKFASLNLLPNHFLLSNINLMILAFKNENYDTAKKIANVIKEKEYSNLSEEDGNRMKMVRKVLKSSKTGDKYDMECKGVFCYDTMKCEDGGKICRLCYVNSLGGDVCMCCEIGILE